MLKSKTLVKLRKIVSSQLLFSFHFKRPNWLFYTDYEKYRQNLFMGPLNFMFVIDISFKFFKLQISPLNFTFITDRSFMFFK
jgi:hypothetical protein